MCLGRVRRVGYWFVFLYDIFANFHANTACAGLYGGCMIVSAYSAYIDSEEMIDTSCAGVTSWLISSVWFNVGLMTIASGYVRCLSSQAE